jgi:hypothetical protein
MHFRMLAVVCLSSLASHAAIAAEYVDFLRDLAGPYAHYRQALMLTSNPDNIDKASQSISQFSLGWKGIVEKYAGDPPKPFATIPGYADKLGRPLTISQEAQALMAAGKVTQAHTVLEDIRYLLWGMRVQAGINSVADKANDFHEAMEIILDHAAAAKSAEELATVEARYGAWVAIKWEEHALAADLGSVRKEFDVALSDGRKTIADYRTLLRNGNLEAAKKMVGPIKNAYKKIWAIDPK